MKMENILVLQDKLLSAIKDFTKDYGNAALHSLSKPLFENLDRIEVSPRHHPAINSLSEMEHLLLPEARSLFQTLMDASLVLAWRNSYSIEDGFGQEYLDRYAWCDIIGPHGVFISHQYRIGFGYWRKGLFYPAHSHEPEEIYWVLGGGGRFSKFHEPAQHRAPGSVIHHQPFDWHSIDMTDNPMLVLFFWKGANLHRKSDF